MKVYEELEDTPIVIFLAPSFWIKLSPRVIQEPKYGLPTHVIAIIPSRNVKN